MKLPPRYTEKQWLASFDGAEDWNTAINIVEDRIKGRWLDAADKLLDEPHAGFAIIAIDCIVLESVWVFINGRPVPRRGEQQVYQDILTGPRFGWTPDQSESFRELVRNGLIHDAETRKRWLIGKTVPGSVVPRLKKSGEYQLNRTKFHNALKGTFEDWGSEASRRGRCIARQNAWPDEPDRHNPLRAVMGHCLSARPWRRYRRSIPLRLSPVRFLL